MSEENLLMSTNLWFTASAVLYLGFKQVPIQVNLSLCFGLTCLNVLYFIAANKTIFF
jgi:hypothetical protein